MDSNNLKKYGFTGWYPFSLHKKKALLNILPSERGVYVVRYKNVFGRFKGKSDIMYIGSSEKREGGLKHRIRFYFKPGPTQKTSLRIYALLSKTDGLEISFVTKENDAESRVLEKELRQLYERDHGEFPPWNRNA